MPLDRSAQRLQIVSPFKAGKNPALAIKPGPFRYEPCHLPKTLLRHPHPGQGIIPMGIKPGRDQYEVRPEAFSRRTDLFSKIVT